mgnify:CR=1 FL=1
MNSDSRSSAARSRSGTLTYDAAGSYTVTVRLTDDAEVEELVAKGAKLFVHDPGRFAYLDSGGPGGAIFELMQRPRQRSNP